MQEVCRMERHPNLIPLQILYSILEMSGKVEKSHRYFIRIINIFRQHCHSCRRAR
jgi:hypothetical protein